MPTTASPIPLPLGPNKLGRICRGAVLALISSGGFTFLLLAALAQEQRDGVWLFTLGVACVLGADAARRAWHRDSVISTVQTALETAKLECANRINENTTVIRRLQQQVASLENRELEEAMHEVAEVAATQAHQRNGRRLTAIPRRPIEE